MKTKPPGRGAEGRCSKDFDNPSVHRADDPRKQRPAGLSAVGQYGMPERWWRALRTGDGLAPGYSGVSSLIGALVASEAPESVIHALLHDTGNAGAAMFHTTSKGRPRPYGEADGMIRRALANKRRWMASAGKHLGDRYDAIVFAASVADEAAARPEAWRGQGGATDVAVLMALVGIAQRSGRWEFHASVRTVAEDAGVGIATACRSLGRLVAGRWLRRMGKASGEAANRYRLAVPDRGTNWNIQPVPSGTTTSVPLGSSPGLDTWRWGGGLGKAARRTWAMLPEDEAVSSASLAKAIGITPRGVRKQLAVLATYGLARRVADGWMRGEADPEAVGAGLAVAGTGDRQRERHRIDRENRAAYLARGRQRRRTWREGDTEYTFLPRPDGTSITVAAPVGVFVPAGVG